MVPSRISSARKVPIDARETLITNVIFSIQSVIDFVESPDFQHFFFLSVYFYSSCLHDSLTSITSI